MKTMKMLLAISKNKSNQKGFSLVELMVVVAIIGILAAVAVPSVNKYMAKARQTEAKTNLSSYYGAQKVFFTDYGIFDSKFTVIGFRPEGNLRYNVGINIAGMAAGFGVGQLGSYGYTVNPVASPTYVARGAVGIGYCHNQAGAGGYAQAGCRWTADSAPLVTNGGCAPVLNATTDFIACAAGKITNRAVWDAWSIDQNKRMLNVADGTE